MAVKPIYAAGLDAGSRSTRLVVAALEEGRIRFLGCASTPSQGWLKGRIADQGAVAESVVATLREVEAGAGVSVESVVVGVGGPTLRGANGRGVLDWGAPAGNRSARRQPRGGPRLARSAARRPHAPAAVPAGFRGGRLSRPPRSAQNGGLAAGYQRPPGDRLRAGAHLAGRRREPGAPGRG